VAGERQTGEDMSCGRRSQWPAAPRLAAAAGDRDFVKELEAGPFEDFEFFPSTIGACPLGGLGAARQLLRSWSLRDA
jgi:hypothetical protein